MPLTTATGPFASSRFSVTQQKNFGTFTVFHFESPKASELGTEYEEAPLLKEACTLSSHRFFSFRPISRQQFEEQIEYIFNTWEVHEGEDPRKVQFSLHLSCHGNEYGIQLGKNFLIWKDLGLILKNSKGVKDLPFILTLSSCGSENSSLVPSFGATPLYVFSFTSEVTFADAALAWAILYRGIRTLKIGNKDGVQRCVNAVRQLGLGPLRYHRWTGETYKNYPTAKDAAV